MTQTKIIDKYGREFPYLRLSLTDVCNYSCQYCLPDGYQCHTPKSFLTLPEITRLVTAFAELGCRKIRLTGGEPTVRKDFSQVLEVIANTPGIECVALTTNGYKLKERVKGWVDNGLTHLNVSVDTLDPRLFHELTGHNRLAPILEGVDTALDLPLKKVKLNAVLLKDINAHQFDDYANFIKDKPVSMRFIELMQTGDNLDYFKRYHVSAQHLKNYLFSRGWTEKLKDKDAGPAQEFFHPEYAGTFGVIAPYSKDFCNSCNRLRVSSSGDFHLCLFGEQGYSLRHLLEHDEQREALKAFLLQTITLKRSQHFLHQGNTGITPHLASVGG